MPMKLKFHAQEYLEQKFHIFLGVKLFAVSLSYKPNAYSLQALTFVKPFRL